MKDEISVYGVSANGESKFLGTTLMSPKMKARELATEQFGAFLDGDGSDAEMCHYALEQMAEHCEKFYTQNNFKPAQPPAWRL